MASGLFAYLDDATATKPIHPAWAAHGALVATRLAALGAEGPPGVLEGRFGLYHAFVDTRIDLEPQLADLGAALGDAADRLQGLPRVPLHPRLARRDRVARSAEIDPDEVEDIARLRCPRRASRSCSSRPSRRSAPRTDYEGKFSLQYSTAAMLVHGRVGLATYTPDALADERVLGLARKVRYETSEYASYPAAFPGGVRIALRDGETLEADLPYQLGAPENPMTDDAGAGEVPRERRARGRVVRGARRRRSSSSRHADDVHAVLSLLGAEAVAA